MKFIMLMGIAGSGKSHIAKDYEKAGYMIHSSDRIRKEIYGSEEIQGRPSVVYEILARRLKADLEHGHPCLMDATNLSRKRRAHLLRTLSDYADKKVCILVLADPDTCLKRNATRDRVVPPEKVYGMLCSFEAPYYYEGWDEIKVVITGDTYVFPREEADSFSQDNPHHELTLGGHLDAARDYSRSEDYPAFLQEAAWYHDIGKMYTKSFFNKKGIPTETAHYYGHENYSAYLYLCEHAASAIHNGKWEDTLYITNLINWHMRPLNAWDQSRKAEDRDRKMIGEDMYADIKRLNQADRAAH